MAPSHMNLVAHVVPLGRYADVTNVSQKTRESGYIARLHCAGGLRTITGRLIEANSMPCTISREETPMTAAIKNPNSPNAATNERFKH